MIADHNRLKVYDKSQHPYNHSAADVAYTNGALPSGVGATMQGVLDYIVAVLYPQAKTGVATVAALPSVGNTLGDYRIVADNGHGVAGGYRWEQREGDAAGRWYEIYAMNWGADSVLSQFLNQTQNVYVNKFGFDDIDSGGTVVAGSLAGQTIYGGRAASSNLTFYPNAGDAAGAVSGFVQTAATFRPLVTASCDVGTASLKFRTGYFGTSILAGTATVSGGTYADSSGAVSFGALNLSTTGTLAAGNTTVTGFVHGTTATFGNLSLSGDTLATTDSNGDLLLTPNGTGSIRTSRCYPASDAASDLGKTAARYQNLYLSGAVGDGTNTIAIAVLMSLRGINAGVGSNNVAAWNGSAWAPVDPNTLITHSSIGGLTTGDAGHTQFALLAGRSGGQSLIGGTAGSNNLTLQSTSHVTRGTIQCVDSLAPTTGSTGAVDLGVASVQLWRNIYANGQAIGLRTENYTTAGRPAAGNAGRHYWDTTTAQDFTDDGSLWRKTGLELTVVDDTTGWTGAVTTVTYTVSASCNDARKCNWTFKDVTNNYLQVQGADITCSQTQVTVTFGIAPASGTYRLVGVG